MRKNLYEILSNKDIDLRKEYLRIYSFFYISKYYDGYIDATLENHINNNFNLLNKKLTHRCISFADFNDSYGFNFIVQRQNIDIDYLILFAEYVVNLVYAYSQCASDFINDDLFNIVRHIMDCMDDIGFKTLEKEDLIIFTEKNPVAISVAETVGDELSYSVLEYNHHRMKGDLLKKKNILKIMAEDLEPDRNKLNGINKNLTSDLFQLFNRFIRHNSSKDKFITNMSEEQIEDVYDDIYQMWLLAKMQLEQANRSDKIKKLINDINVK